MINDEYKLRYLPLFYEDVRDIVIYIKNNLGNPAAANNLINKVEKAILERLPVCESFEPFNSKKERRYKYYRIYVENYIVYYVVIDDEEPSRIMEIRRLLYKKRDRENIL